MAPNGTTSRKSMSHTFQLGVLSSNQPLSAPAASKPIKREESTQSDGLFEDMFDEGSPKINDDTKKTLPTTKKAGSWDTEASGGTLEYSDKDRRRHTHG